MFEKPRAMPVANKLIEWYTKKWSANILNTIYYKFRHDYIGWYFPNWCNHFLFAGRKLLRDRKKEREALASSGGENEEKIE